MALEDTYLDSEILAGLRMFVELYPAFQQVAGPLARFRIVLDANMAVADLAHKYKHPHLGRTAIEETVKSSALELHAPTWLDEEMTNSTIPQFAARRGIPEPELRALWIKYKEQIIWSDTAAYEDDATPGGDSKDVPYVVLQKRIEASGVLSWDKDIEHLGGKRLELEFVLSVRSYARAASYAVGIRVGGILITTVSLGLLGQTVKAITASISRLPPAVKVALIAGAVFVAVHPQSRERMLEFLKATGRVLVDAWPAIVALMETASEKQAEAQAALGNTERLLSA